MRIIGALIIALSAQIAFGQSHSFRDGFIYASENTDNFRVWIREIDPSTGASRRFGGQFDQLLLLNGLAFTPDGRRLRVLEYWEDTVTDYDADGNGLVVYDSTDGICGPYGQNGIVFDRARYCYIANNACFDLLRFPPDGGPAVRIGSGQGSLAFGSDGALFMATGSYRIIRIEPDGTHTIFEDFPAQHYVSSLATNSAGDLFAAVGGPSQAGIYRYDQAQVENKRLLSAEVIFAACITMSADESELYIVSTYFLGAMDAQTGAWRVIFNFPGISEGFGGHGLTVYVAPKPGDLNCDRRVDFYDIDAFIAALTGRARYEAAYPACDYTRADLNGDGTVNPFDIQPFVELLDGP